jgi:uncharacterized LabA/DUF88 family protein
MAKRVSFLIDGFNLYHSLRDLQRMTGKSVKWLDLKRLCSGYIQNVKTGLGQSDRVDIATIHYFSAVAEHLKASKPDVPQRHDLYLNALRSTGVVDHLGQFKRKTRACKACGAEIVYHEEKETDVAIGLALLEVFARNECDAAVIVSGDTDLIPAVRSVKKLFGGAKKVGVAFPFNRRNNEPQNYADFYFNIKQKEIERAQLPNPVVLPDGTKLQKPKSW